MLSKVTELAVRFRKFTGIGLLVFNLFAIVWQLRAFSLISWLWIGIPSVWISPNITNSLFPIFVIPWLCRTSKDFVSTFYSKSCIVGFCLNCCMSLLSCVHGVNWYSPIVRYHINKVSPHRQITDVWELIRLAVF